MMLKYYAKLINSKFFKNMEKIKNISKIFYKFALFFTSVFI